MEEGKLIYKYIGADTDEELINIIKYFINDGTVRASDPRTFNDPSEFKVYFDFEADKEIIKKRYFQDNNEATNKEFESWFSTFDERSKWSINYEVRQQMLDSIGVVCFTSEPTNYLMWSHYAKNHTGVCIGFNRSILTSIEDCESYEYVKYTNNVPIVKYYHDTKKKIYRSVFFNKDTCWKYEKEIRVITQGNGIKAFDKNLVREIIIGCNASHEVERFVRSLMGSSLITSQCISTPRKYKLKKEPLLPNIFVERS